MLVGKDPFNPNLNNIQYLDEIKDGISNYHNVEVS